MTTPTQKQGIHALKGWHHFTSQLGTHLPWSLTNGARALRSVLTMTGKRG